ncbi:MAG TPA: septation ring formation regulator EzrA [Candidatus Pelethosoma merdigallinarum]|nr:septation ring formation regulator EzrA [Candidatus Pelethosoma merdigallinarum]
MNHITLLLITLYFVTVLLVVTILNLIQGRKKKRIKKELEKLEYEKNIIDSIPIISELDKVGSLSKNEKMELAYNEWKDRLENIKNSQIPRITDMLIEADYSLSQMDYKTTMYKIAKLEMELYKVKANSDFLLNEIKDITESEERNRDVITKLKVRYRELYQQFQSKKLEYGEYADIITLQFENIAKRFEEFEDIMEKNEYTEVGPIITAIDEMLKHMSVVVEEVPSIVLLATTVLPTKMREVWDQYQAMMQKNYPLDYLNIEYNLEEANKKIEDILERLRELNLEDSLFELKVLLDYFENVFNDFDKEKVNRSTYEETNESFVTKLTKINQLLSEIFGSLDELKSIYNLSKSDIDLLNTIKKEMDTLNEDYKVLMSHTGNNTFAYSKLTKEIESLMVRLSSIEDKLDMSLNTLGSMKEDEVRARQQLEEVRNILKEAKNQIRGYNLPVIPKSYFTELKEAQAAIKEIVKELNKKPITIDVLNTRVDTARDLVLKLYAKTKEMMKTAMFAEMAIVYGNRYRSTGEEVNKNLTYAEVLFYKGEYQKSLELTINSLNRIEPGLYQKLLEFYGNK